MKQALVVIGSSVTVLAVLAVLFLTRSPLVSSEDPFGYCDRPSLTVDNSGTRVKVEWVKLNPPIARMSADGLRTRIYLGSDSVIGQC